MYQVYVLQSLKDQRTYVGYTSDMKRRLAEHNRGQVTATKYRRPLCVLYQESVTSLALAKAREMYWKSGAGRRQLKKLFSAVPHYAINSI